MRSQPDGLRRRNHFVPASYLSAFTPDPSRERFVWAYDRRTHGDAKRLSLKTVGLQKDLYLRNVNGEPDDTVERFLADSVEKPFTEIHRRIVYGSRVGFIPSAPALGTEARRTVARFAAFQLFRTPVEREATRWLGEISSQNLLRERLGPGGPLREKFERRREGPLTPREVAELHDFFAGWAPIKSASEDWIPRTFRNAERFARLIERLVWRVVAVPRSVELVTCDMPFVCVRRGNEPGAVRLGGAFSDRNFEATLALSPAHVLVFAYSFDDERFLRTPEFAESVRRRTIAYASRWVYARSHDERITHALESSQAPHYHVEFAGHVFRAGHPAGEIDRAIRASGVTNLKFRYGVPGDDSEIR